MGYFEMVSPEDLQIDAKGITDFLDKTRRSGLELHKLMILRHGKCCAKVIWRPYREEDLHPLYSFSKSLTATAIAFARQEGLLSLDEKLVDLFPDKLPAEPSENLKACTIHHLLSMSCGHETEIAGRNETWIEDFLAHPFLHAPGTFYQYNTPGTNLLAAIVFRKTGQQVTQYLRSRLFDPLGIGEVFCYRLPDPDRIEAGGGGMKMSLEDMAKFSQFMLQDGCWEGKQLLKDWYLSRAGVKQMETEGDAAGHIRDWAQGYGYQCWMGSQPRSFRADGAFGQFGLIYPTPDMCVVMNSCTEQTQTIMDAVNDCLIPAVDRAQSIEGLGSRPFLITSELHAVQSCHNPYFENILNHRTYAVSPEGKMCGLRHLVGGAGQYELPEEPEILSMSFSFEEDRLVWHLGRADGTAELKAGLDGSFTHSTVDGVSYAAAAAWRSLRKLEIEIRSMKAMSGVRLLLRFEGDEISIETDDTLMTDGGLGIAERSVCDFCLVSEESDDAEKYAAGGNNPAVVKEED